jgi:hypothetical protein
MARAASRALGSASGSLSASAVRAWKRWDSFSMARAASRALGSASGSLSASAVRALTR